MSNNNPNNPLTKSKALEEDNNDDNNQQSKTMSENNSESLPNISNNPPPKSTGLAEDNSDDQNQQSKKSNEDKSYKNSRVLSDDSNKNSLTNSKIDNLTKDLNFKTTDSVIPNISNNDDKNEKKEKESIKKKTSNGFEKKKDYSEDSDSDSDSDNKKKETKDDKTKNDEKDSDSDSDNQKKETKYGKTKNDEKDSDSDSDNQKNETKDGKTEIDANKRYSDSDSDSEKSKKKDTNKGETFENKTPNKKNELKSKNDDNNNNDTIEKYKSKNSSEDENQSKNRDMIKEIQSQTILESQILAQSKIDISSNDDDNNSKNKENSFKKKEDDNKSNLNYNEPPEMISKEIENEKEKNTTSITKEKEVYPSITVSEINNLNKDNGFYMSNIKNENDNEIENKEKNSEEENNENNQVNDLLNKKNKDLSIDELFNTTFEINKNVNNKIKNYQNEIEKIIKKEFDDLKINNSLDSKLGLYLKFRDTYHLTYRESVKFENSNIKCKYCEKDIFGYVNKIKIEGFKEITYCSSCMYKIIPKFKSPLTINLVKNKEKVKEVPERIKDYSAKIESIEVNGDSNTSKIIEYDYGKVPENIKLIINLKNNGKKNWPADSKLDIDKLNPNNYFSIGYSKVGEVKAGKEKEVNDIEIKHINKLPPGNYYLILAVHTSKKIFGNINDMTIKISINI